MAKKSTAKAGAKQAAPARAAEAAQEPVKAAKRASKAAPAASTAPKVSVRKKPATTVKPAAVTPTRAPARAAAKPAAKPATKPATTPARAKAGTSVAQKAARKLVAKAPAARPTVDDAGKSRLVRDSFTMPEQEYAVLAAVKQGCLKAGFEVKKSELLRIGVALLSQLDMATLQGVLASLPQLKTGRPRTR